MISVQVKKRQGRFLVDVGFEAPCKGVIALFGPSGAGKTSLINMTAGLLTPDEGHIGVNDTVLFDAASGINLPPEKRRIGYVFQDGRLFPHLSVKANLTYGMRQVPEERRYVNLDQVVALLGIGDLLKRRPAKLSGGEKQRVAIGRALLTSPSLLLMDEPLASLDEARKGEVLPFIAELANNFSIPIFYVSHVWAEIEFLADICIKLDNGQVTSITNL